MKRVIKYFLLLTLTFSFLLTTVSAAKDKKEVKDTSKEETKVVETKKVNLYLFRQTGCPHCADEMIYLNEILEKYEDKLNVRVFNVYDGNNSQLVTDALAEINETYSGAPCNIVGKKTFVGFADSIADSFEEYIKAAIDAKETDIVGKLIDSGKYEDLVETSLKDAMKEENLSVEDSKDSSTDSIIILAIFGGIIIAAGVVIFFSKKN